MKRTFTIAAALLLASCDTLGYPPGDPYGAPEPYPPVDPFPPPQPYPPGGPYGLPQPYPPGGPYAPAAPVEACPIESSRDWRASVATIAGPEARTILTVTGTVVARTGGYRMEFVPDLTVIRSYPVQMVARLLAIPPDGPATQALATHRVRWQWPLAGPVGTVAIRCGDRTLANITPVGTGG